MRRSDYDVWEKIWPSSPPRPLSPVRVGVDRRSGQMLFGWPHTEQSMYTLFATRFHERILRQWVGSFVPHMLGAPTTEETITQFWWAIIVSIELWEPNYTVQQVRFAETGELNVGDALKKQRMNLVSQLRRGEVAFRAEGGHRPRGHLGNFTIETSQHPMVMYRNGSEWYGELPNE